MFNKFDTEGVLASHGFTMFYLNWPQRFGHFTQVPWGSCGINEKNPRRRRICCCTAPIWWSLAPPRVDLGLVSMPPCQRRSAKSWVACRLWDKRSTREPKMNLRRSEEADRDQNDQNDQNDRHLETWSTAHARFRDKMTLEAQCGQCCFDVWKVTWCDSRDPDPGPACEGMVNPAWQMLQRSHLPHRVSQKSKGPPTESLKFVLQYPAIQWCNGGCIRTVQ